MQRARRKWRTQQRHWDPARLVFLDETWANTNMARRYGRAPRGQRCVAAVPHGHWKTTTFIAALRHDGLSAPMLLDFAWLCQAEIEQFLLCWARSCVDCLAKHSNGSRPIAHRECYQTLDEWPRLHLRRL